MSSPSAGLGPLILVANGIHAELQIADCIDRCRTAKEIGHENIRRAIYEVMTENPGANGRVYFADPGFGEENAMFSPNTYLFGINTDLSPQDNDVVIDARKEFCPVGDHICNLASVAHPTAEGSRRYAEAIGEQLKLAFPSLLG
jgi:hypothetical protein